MVIGVILFGIYIYSFDETTYQLLFDRLMMNDSSAGTRTIYLETYINDASITQLLFGVGTSASGFFLGGEGFFYGASVVWAPESNFITFFIEQGIFIFISLSTSTLPKDFCRCLTSYIICFLSVIILTPFYASEYSIIIQLSQLNSA